MSGRGEPVSDGGGDGATRRRKSEHLELAADAGMQLDRRHFDRYRLPHRALPEMALEEVDMSVSFLGRTLRAPFLISSMTGGTGEAGRINRRLAEAAEACGVALGVGSQRVAVEDPDRRDTFRVRDRAPGVPLLANLGAVQLNYGYGVEECRRAVEMIEADALVLHLNPLQEAIQPEGDTDFRGLTARMGTVARALEVPVVAKEIGCGVSAATGRALLEEGIRIVDAAGVGGTSWARIESRRAREPGLGEVFSDWGIPTPEAVRELAAVEGLTVIGSGGVRTGVDAAKALALGADLVGMAQPFLEPAREGVEAVVATVRRRVRELRTAMFCAGARTLEELGAIQPVVGGPRGPSPGGQSSGASPGRA